MSYRSETRAALDRLVALEVELASRRSLRLALRSYRAALCAETERLEHALVWYRNGERFGWNRFEERDDLAATQPPELRLPGAAQLARAYARLDSSTVAARTVEVEQALALGDWRSCTGRLRLEVESLRQQCARMRTAVEIYARCYPDHPPPPALPVGSELALSVTASVGGLWVALLLLTMLLSG